MGLKRSHSAGEDETKLAQQFYRIGSASSLKWHEAQAARAETFMELDDERPTDGDKRVLGTGTIRGATRP
jgi:hypothetical protein